MAKICANVDITSGRLGRDGKGGESRFLKTISDLSSLDYVMTKRHRIDRME